MEDIFFSPSEEFDNLPPVRLKSVGRVVKGVQRWKPAVEKMAEYMRCLGERRTHAIYLQAKTGAAPLFTPAPRRNESPEFIGAIFRRNENCPLYFAQ